MAEAGLKAIYLSGWQVAADANDAGQMYPDQSLYPADSVPAVVRRINNAPAPRRPGPAPRRAPRSRLLPADRGRRRGRLRRTAERLRADEGHDRSRRRRRPLRGPAGQRKEMRAHGGQGAGADHAVRPHADRRAAGRRRARRAHRAGRPHRCQQRATDHQRRRPARPAVHHRRAHGRRLLPHYRRAGDRHRSRAVVCPVCRPAVVRNLDARPGRGPAICRGRFTPSSRQAAGLQLLASRSTGRRSSTRRPLPASSASWGRWATSSSSSRWPASTP